jgi:hypothetical protein
MEEMSLRTLISSSTSKTPGFSRGCPKCGLVQRLSPQVQFQPACQACGAALRSPAVHPFLSPAQTRRKVKSKKVNGIEKRIGFGKRLAALIIDVMLMRGSRPSRVKFYSSKEAL